MTVSSRPAEGETIPRTEWLVIELAAPPDEAALAWVHVDCGDGTPEYDTDLAGATTIVLNPRGELPAGASCEASWESEDGSQGVSFLTAGRGEPAVVAYDRDDLSVLTPFPDDVFLIEDANTTTGQSVNVPSPDRPGDVQLILGNIASAVKGIDGFSPSAPVVVSLPVALDVASLPQSLEQSLSPLSTVALINVTEGSATRGERVPIHLLPRSESNADGTIDHTLIVMPGPLLTYQSQYALVITRRALVDPTRPLEASPSLGRVMSGAPTTPAEEGVGEVLGPVLGALESHVVPPIRRDDIALVHRFSIRSDMGIPDDMLSIRAQLQAIPPSFTVRAVDAHPNENIAAVVTGIWEAPQFRDGDYIARDDSGAPRLTETSELDFVLVLPSAALEGPVPIVMYQHGTPGSAEAEVLSSAGSGGLAGAGYAVVGFTDIVNREIIKSGPGDALGQYIFTSIASNARIPELNTTLNTAEQLAFLRVIAAMGELDVLPIGAPDGEVEIEPSQLLYFGISQGSDRGVALLPYAPEIRAAALVVAAGREGAVLVHQSSDSLYEGAVALLPNLRRTELYVGVALYQMGLDDSDPISHARFLYDGRIDLGANGTRASVLMTEGLNDSMIPPYATQAAAREMGLPHLEPWATFVPYLERSHGSISGNINETTTGAFAQFVPAGIEGMVPTEGCDTQFEGHFCAQTAPGAVAQRMTFFASALTGVPVIEPAL
jgi:hypothetical protein